MMVYELEWSGEWFYGDPLVFLAEERKDAFKVVAEKTGIDLTKEGNLNEEHFDAIGAEVLTEDGLVIFPPSKVVCH